MNSSILSNSGVSAFIPCHARRTKQIRTKTRAAVLHINLVDRYFVCLATVFMYFTMRFNQFFDVNYNDKFKISINWKYGISRRNRTVKIRVGDTGNSHVN